MRTLFLVVVLGAMMAGCGKSESSSDNYSLEHKVAIVNAGHFVPADDISVNRIGYLLGSLEASTDYPREKIAGQVATARDIIRKDYGKEVSILDILEAANKAEAVRTKTVKLEEYLALYATFAGQ